MDNAGRRGRRFGRSRAALSLAQHAVAGIVPGDHVCASFGSDAEHEAIVARYARQALRRGERLLYFAHASDDATIRAFLEREGIDAEAGIALGQIEIRRVQRGRARVDPDELIAELRAGRHAALRDGYSALCATTEMSWALARPGDLDALARYERAADRVLSQSDVAGLCQYDRRLFEPDVLDRLVAAHDFQICTGAQATTTSRRRLTISEQDDGVIALSGALDIDSSAYLAARLAEFGGRDDLVVLTAGLGFADVAGSRALVQAAAERGQGRLVLPDAAEPLVRVLKLCGWSSSQRLTLT